MIVRNHEAATERSCRRGVRGLETVQDSRSAIPTIAIFADRNSCGCSGIGVESVTSQDAIRTVSGTCRACPVRSKVDGGPWTPQPAFFAPSIRPPTPSSGFLVAIISKCSRWAVISKQSHEFAELPRGRCLKLSGHTKGGRRTRVDSLLTL